MVPPIHFIIFVLNFSQLVLEYLDNIEDVDRIPNIILLTGLINIINILNLIVQNLDLIMIDDRRENDIYKLIRLCDQYR